MVYRSLKRAKAVVSGLEFKSVAEYPGLGIARSSLVCIGEIRERCWGTREGLKGTRSYGVVLVLVYKTWASSISLVHKLSL